MTLDRLDLHAVGLALLDDLIERSDLLLVQLLHFIVAHEADADRSRVVTEGVSSNPVQATTLPEASSSVDDDVVADIGPTVRSHVLPLNGAHLSLGGSH